MRAIDNRLRCAASLADDLIGPVPDPDRRSSRAGHGTRMAANRVASDKLIAYHEARARGGAGLIIT
ncbi:MAG: hypothetical protein AAF367_06525 [Pseudomonadota bacterium]